MDPKAVIIINLLKQVKHNSIVGFIVITHYYLILVVLGST